MSNQANVMERDEHRTKRRKTAKTEKNSKNRQKGTNRGPNHRARGMARPCHPGMMWPCHMARSCPRARRPVSRFSI